MKAGLQIAFVALLAGGCVHSTRFQNDPRAAVVGPKYLDYMQQYPMDRVTQYYYPTFGVSGAPHRGDLFAGIPDTVPPEVQRLETVIPLLPPSVQAIEGKGWPELERKGLPLFLSRQE